MLVPENLKIRIRGVETIPLRLPFARSFTMAAPGETTRDHIDVLLVRLHSDAGVAGIGETQAWRRQGSAETLAGLSSLINEVYAPLLIGRSPFDVASIMKAASDRAGNLYALAAVSDALYDLSARALGVPIHVMLGGRSREQVAVGIAVSITDPVDALLGRVQELVDGGYRHIRLKIGLDVEKDVLNVRKVREAFGDKIVLRADANGGMSYDDALRLLHRLEPFDLDIVEQPIAGWDLAGMAALGRSAAVPLSADESVTSAHSLIEIARLRAASVIQTKTAKNGGLFHIQRLWAIAEATGIGIFPGNHPSSGISVASVTQLCAAWPGKLLVGDYQTGACDMIADDIVANPLRPVNGAIAVPNGPGLGVELDDDKVRHYRVDH
jgi:muconate cycloisomerase